MIINQADHIADNRRRQSLMAAGAGLGVSGAWIGNFTRLAAYQPYFLAATLACLGYGYWLIYRSSMRACADGEACARPLPNRIVKISLILATILVAAALGLDFIVPLFLDS